MSNNTDMNTTQDEIDESALQNDPVLRGKSAMTDPELSGSTTSSWTEESNADPTNRSQS